METTSHFVGIELNPEYFSDLFVNLYQYLKKNNVTEILTFQNLLSLHITLYYFEADLNKTDIEKIKAKIEEIGEDFSVNTGDFRYFERERDKIIGYIYGNASQYLLGIFNIFNGEFNRKEVLENNLKFIPHITLFRINNSQIYEKHRENIEEIVNEKLEKLKNKDISTKRIYLYKVNSKFPGELQIKI